MIGSPWRQLDGCGGDVNIVQRCEEKVRPDRTEWEGEVEVESTGQRVNPMVTIWVQEPLCLSTPWAVMHEHLTKDVKRMVADPLWDAADSLAFELSRLVVARWTSRRERIQEL